ncbi:LysR family transcriptional regulator [Enterovirga sp.]|uniref:LysR family transcriptional regulator n=1 Tax=Enterovirga sp. TaxID=2026350 RepID=UPI002B8D7C83|nr:LysR family transcriptional regulator [Enterovirga sp.]HMO29232.1 LysR family transcriptional regulator [Enterovirga sp.]
MNLRFLEAFVWVVRLRSFRAAAERLNLTQAAISSRIATLEDDFGQKLFTRDPRELRLTPSGRLLLGYAERMLDLGRDMRAAMNSSRELTGVLRIGVVETVVHTWLPDFLSALHERHAALEVQLTADSTIRLHDDLRRGLLDIAVQTDPVLHEGISNREIGSMQMGWVGIPEDSRDQGTPLSIGDLVSRPIVTMTRGSQPHRALLEACRRAGATPKTIHCVGSLAAIVRLVRAGFGIATLPLAAIHGELAAGTLAVIPCEVDLGPLRLVVSYRDDPGSDAAEGVATLVAEEAMRFASAVGPDLARPLS